MPLLKYPQGSTCWVYALAEIKIGRRPEDTLWEICTDSEAQISSEQDSDSSADASSLSEDELIHVGEAPNLDEKIEGWDPHEVNWETCTSLSMADALPKAEDGKNYVSEELELDTGTEDFVSVRSQPDVDESRYPWRREDFLCLRCWEKFCHSWRGNNEASHTVCSDSTSNTDASSEHEYSPYLFHT